MMLPWASRLLGGGDGLAVTELTLAPPADGSGDMSITVRVADDPAGYTLHLYAKHWYSYDPSGYSDYAELEYPGALDLAPSMTLAAAGMGQTLAFTTGDPCDDAVREPMVRYRIKVEVQNGTGQPVAYREDEQEWGLEG